MDKKKIERTYPTDNKIAYILHNKLRQVKPEHIVGGVSGYFIGKLLKDVMMDLREKEAIQRYLANIPPGSEDYHQKVQLAYLLAKKDAEQDKMLKLYPILSGMLGTYLVQHALKSQEDRLNKT